MCFCLPLITVGELHIHAVSAQEGFAVQRRVDVGRVWDGVAHQDSAGERRLFEATQASRRAAVVHLEVSSTMQNLEEAAGGRNELTECRNKAEGHRVGGISGVLCC